MNKKDLQRLEEVLTKIKNGNVDLDNLFDKDDSIRNRFMSDSISVNGKTLYANDFGGLLSQALDEGVIKPEDASLIFNWIANQV